MPFILRGSSWLMNSMIVAVARVSSPCSQPVIQRDGPSAAPFARMNGRRSGEPSRCSATGREPYAFVPGAAAYVDGQSGTSSMRLNFSGFDEDRIREGIRRIGKVVSEQVALYETITGEHRLPAASSSSPPGAEDREPEAEELPGQGGDVLPLRRRGKET